MLFQYDENNRLRLIYSVSKKTSREKRNYHSSKLELLAVVYCVNRLRQFLISTPFVIVTNCQAITYLHPNKTSNPQIARWMRIIQQYDCSFQHRVGNRMCHVDAISRSPVEESI